MAELSRGAEAGAVSGVIYGPANWLIINIGVNFLYGNLDSWVAHVMADVMGYLSCIAENLVSGLILGLIFATLYDKFPGRTSAIKGIVISIIYWVAIPLGLPVVSSLYRWGFEGLYWAFDWRPTAIGLDTSMIWGGRWVLSARGSVQSHKLSSKT